MSHVSFLKEKKRYDALFCYYSEQVYKFGTYKRVRFDKKEAHIFLKGVICPLKDKFTKGWKKKREKATRSA